MASMFYQKSEDIYVLGNHLGQRNETDFTCADKEQMKIMKPSCGKIKTEAKI